MFGRALRHLAHRLNPVTIAKETATVVTDRIIPQGAAELSQALNSGANAYVPYGHAQAPVPPTGMWSDRFTGRGQSGPAQSRNQGMGM